MSTKFVIYSCLVTTRSLLDNALSAIKEGEEIHSWEEHNRWSSSQYPLWRVYSETVKDSAAMNILSKSKNYKEISRKEFDEVTGINLANRIWKLIGKTGNVKKPALLMMAGTPLSGKTTLAKEILNSVSEATVFIENDEIRKHVASENGDSSPKYTNKESTRTFNVSRELIRIGLSNKCNVIFDATNLNERSRRGTYEAALQKKADIEISL